MPPSNPMTDTQLEALAHDVLYKVTDLRWPELPKAVILAALKSVRDASAGSPLSSDEENALRRKYAHFRALAICARELLINEATACKSAAIKGRLLDAAKVIDADLRAGWRTCLNTRSHVLS